MANPTKFQAYKDERKWNYVFLLHARYDGSVRRLSTVSGISQSELKNWDQQYRDEVMQFIQSNRVIRGDEAVEKEQSDKVPTIPELIEKVLKRLDSAIAGEADPSSLSRTLQNLYNYNATLKASITTDSERGTISTVADAVKNKLKNK